MIFLRFFLCLFPAVATAKLNVVTTTTDVASLVRQVGGERVEVFSISKGTQDPHQVEAKPSFMVKMSSADIVFAQGLELESAWLQPLIIGARNPKLLEKRRVVELGEQLDPLEVAKTEVSRSLGDVHPFGNPHFQLDPYRMGQAGLLIAKKLSELDASGKEVFLKNATAYEETMKQKTKEWTKRIADTGIKEVITYHKTFSYFCERFRIQCNMHLEPKPGIPPTASHLMEVISYMKREKVNLVLIENSYDDKAAAFLKKEIPGAVVMRLPVSVEGEPNLKTTTNLIERLVAAIEGAKK